jgi:subtilisin family serine protease
VHAAHPHVGGIAGGVAIDASGAEGMDVIDRLGHGTAVAAVIREKAPDAELLAVKVFDLTLAATGRALVAAIEWSAAHEARLINLSLGTVNRDHAGPLLAAVRHAADRGAIVVAAAPQDGSDWLPGGLAGVVAVDVDWTCPRDECHVSIADDGGVRLSASGYPRPIPGVPPERNLSGPSFAVANATGFLARVLDDDTAVRTIAALAARLAAWNTAASEP